MVRPDSTGIPRAPAYSGYARWRPVPFAYVAFTFYGPLSQHGSARNRFCNSTRPLRQPPRHPHNPAYETAAALHVRSLGYFPFRSPLLRESQSSISSPPATEMFHFAGFPPLNAGDWPYARRVAPFGDLRVKGRLRLTEAFRSLPRPSSAVGA